MFRFRRPTLSVIVVAHRMTREMPRTLHSLTSEFQRTSRHDYEVIVVENPSEQMLSPKQVRGYGKQFRYFVNPHPSRSPAGALNFGASKARGRNLLLLIDGARILSPGILSQTLTAHRLYEQPVVAALAWHLGPDNQARSVHNGYCQDVEDQLLSTVDWQQDGYQLFTISSLAGACSMSWFFPILESNCISMSREQFDALGGYFEDFVTDGGGFVNLDFYKRAVSDSRRPLVMLLGEGTFHQFHGGAATNRKDDAPIQAFREEYERLRGKPFSAPERQPVFLGGMPDVAKPFMRLSVNAAEERSRKMYPSLAFAKPVADVSHNTAASKTANRPRMIAVLGMHRSGTSCLAGTLMECGVHFGDVSRKNPYNAKGNNENNQIMQLHDQLLSEAGGSWKSPPGEVRWLASHREQQNAILETFRESGKPVCGFKDPRALFALDGWLDAVPDLELMGIFRHPLAVAKSLTHRNLFTPEQGLQLWLEYNRRLLGCYHRSRIPILYFSPDPSEFRRDLHAQIPALGLRLPASGPEFFDPALQHFSDSLDDELPAEVAELLSELEGIASAQRAALRREAA